MTGEILFVEHPISGVLTRRGRAPRGGGGSGGGTTGDSVTASRDTFVDNTWIPVGKDTNPSNNTAGIPAVVTSLPNYNAISINTVQIPAGVTIKEQTIWGDITPSPGADSYLIRCKIKGGNFVPTTQSACVDCNATRSGGILWLIDCDIDPQLPSLNRDGIVGHKFRAIRCDIKNTIDGIGGFIKTVAGTDADIQINGNYIHDRVYSYPDYANGTSGTALHSDGSHTDGIQLQGGKNILIKNNAIKQTCSYLPGSGTHPTKPYCLAAGYAPGAGIIVQDNTGAGLDNTVDIKYNWMIKGGLSHFTLKPGTYQVHDNHIYRDTLQVSGSWAGYWLRPDANRAGVIVTGLATTNVWVDGPYATQICVEPRDKGIEYS